MTTLQAPMRRSMRLAASSARSQRFVASPPYLLGSRLPNPRAGPSSPPTSAALHSRASPSRSHAQSGSHPSISTLVRTELRPSFLPLRSFAASSTSTNTAPQQTQSQPKSEEKQTEDGAEEEEGPPKGASWRERFRFMTRRYGRWALVVYLLASVVDFSFVFAVIHFFGAEHIKEIEGKVRAYIGLQPHGEDGEGSASTILSNIDLTANNDESRQAAAEYLSNGGSTTTADNSNVTSSSKSSWLSGTLGTEAVLAYTIHKTLFLPFRIAVTAAVLPRFVKLMVRLGWSRPNSAIQQAAKTAAQKAAARKSVT